MNDFETLLNNRTLCEIQADLCAVFTNPERIRILLVLEDREMSVSEIADRLNISMSNLSQHLRLMKDRLCLVSRKEGKNVFYKTASPLFLEAINLMSQGLKDAEKNSM